MLANRPLVNNQLLVVWKWHSGIVRWHFANLKFFAAISASWRCKDYSRGADERKYYVYKSRQIILDVLVDDVHPPDGGELSLGYIVVCLPETTVPNRIAKRSVSVTSYTKDLGDGVGERQRDKGKTDGRVSYNDSLFRTSVTRVTDR